MKGIFIYSKLTDLNVNLTFKKAFTATSRLVFDKYVGNIVYPNWHIK